MDNLFKSLTRKQEAFVYEYLKDHNATQAAIRAGYSKGRASEIGYQLLQKTTVLTALNSAKADMIENLRFQFLNDAVVAREVLYKFMVDPDASNRDKIVAAKDFLDRAGFKPSEKKEWSGSNGDSIEIYFVNPETKNN